MIDGVLTMSINAEGSLILNGQNRGWLQRKPHIFQEQTAVEGRYELRGERRVGFRLGGYDRTKPLVIDPVISYATYLGESDTTIKSITVDTKRWCMSLEISTRPTFP